MDILCMVNVVDCTGEPDFGHFVSEESNGDDRMVAAVDVLRWVEAQLQERWGVGAKVTSLELVVTD